MYFNNLHQQIHVHEFAMMKGYIKIYTMEWMGWSSAIYSSVLSYHLSKQKEWSSTRLIQKQKTHTHIIL